MKRIILFCLAICTTFLLKAQDFHLSQYDAAPLNVNAGLTGVFEGDYRLHAHYRTQWSSVATKPFTTGLFSFDANLKNWGIGLQLANFRAGTGGYNVASVLPSAAYKISLGKKKNHFITIGAQVGFFQKSINASSLEFANQYVKTNGGEFNTTLSNNENIGSNGIFKLDINAGFMYYFAKQGVRVNPFFGANFFHLNKPTESFLSESNKLAIRPQAVAGARVLINPKIAITPKLYYQYQDEASEFTTAVTGQFFLETYDIYLLATAIFRNKDAAIFEFGAKYANFIGRISYDFNTSSLNNVSSGRGGTELSLTYIFSKTNPNPIPTCPKI
ncbi:PorP/SprF family type IX secretion system membrane protein [Crocinitomix catalasitica]|uniref:PorP/SprF family type IX secretion system membrane protein n=1 Tax=Crocinitomix catalasitica TaxID=184607 RepID=UPI000907BD66|nr:PorP/SprF family type IX secretion system membrane protein [Crocinitomix catalasitica]